MTRALVVFESMFGNTQQIAEAVKEGLSTSVPTDILEAALGGPERGTGGLPRRSHPIEADAVERSLV